MCRICTDPRRDASIICVVEQSRDVATLERVGTYRGVYHVLQGRLAPLENIGPEELTIDALLRRVQQGGVKEMIMATNPTLEGDGTALYISNLLAESGSAHHTAGRGVATGSVLEFAEHADARRRTARAGGRFDLEFPRLECGWRANCHASR